MTGTGEQNRRRKCTGRTDAHVHIRDVGGLADLLSAGIDCVRDAGMRPDKAPLLGSMTGGCTGIRVVSARWAVYKKGGYGSAFGVAVESISEIEKEIANLKREGAGVIKVMASGMVSLEKKGVVTAGGFSKHELAVIVEESARYGLGVMVHANGPDAILAATQAGACSIEHGFFMTEQALAAMARSKTLWVPTVGALARAADSDSVSGDMKAYIEELISKHLAMVRRAYALGVPLAIGTDCVLPDVRYAAAYESELAYLRKAGLSTEAVAVISSFRGEQLSGSFVRGQGPDGSGKGQ